MKTDETKGSYDAEVADAMEMLGKGYDSKAESLTNKFHGFAKPTENYSKLPHEFIKILPDIDSLAELKVVLYVLRHTWGFSEYDKPKKMTLDELQNGRKKRDGSRMDGGTGLSINSIKAGAEKAVDRGILKVEVDESDLARIEKRYCLSMSPESSFDDGLSNLDSRPSEADNRTEKETKERKNTEKPDIVDLELQKKFKQDEKEPAFIAFESDMGTPGNWSWYPSKTTQERDWKALREFVVKLHAADPDCFKKYHAWRNQPYVKGAMSNRQIKNYPSDFEVSWSDFAASSSLQKAPPTLVLSKLEDDGVVPSPRPDSVRAPRIERIVQNGS